MSADAQSSQEQRNSSASGSADNEAPVSVPAIPGSRRYSSEAHALTRGVVFAYCFFRIPLSPLDITVRLNARTTIWQDQLKMTAATQAMLISALKSLDFLLGFIVGKASDDARTRCGRRRPFIMIGFPIGLAAFLMFTNAGYMVQKEPSWEAPCSNLLRTEDTDSCPDLKACLQNAIEAGTMWNHTNTSLTLYEDQNYSQATLSVFFSIFYFSYYFCMWTASLIPYDALGLELTDDYHLRTYLFSTKTVFMFLGYLLPPVAGILLGSFITNVLMITTVRSIIFATLGMIAYFVLLAGVKERDLPPVPPNQTQGTSTDSQMKVPIIPAVRRALQNKPYQRYLMMKIPLTLYSLIPSNMLSFLIKYTLAIENWTLVESVVFLCALIGGLVGIPATYKMSKRIGKAKTLTWILYLDSIFFIAFMFIPYTTLRALTWPVVLPIAFAMGVGQTLAFGLPDAILADIIDYDELRTGERNEGIYTVVETSLQQLVEIFGGAIPLVVLGAVGYKPLAGCDCGCGIPCKDLGVPYARWICPNNVGYTCTGEVESTLLFAPEPAVAPCADMGAASIWVMQTFLVGLPGILGILAGFMASQQLITPEIAKSIERQLKDPSVDLTDPFTGEPIVHPANTREALIKEYMSHGELRMIQQAGIGPIKKWIGGRILLWILLFILIIILMAVTGMQSVVTFGCLFVGVLFVMIPWDIVRFRSLSQHKDFGKEETGRTQE